MGILDSFLKDDATAFTDSDLFGESITYVPLSGSQRSISGVITHSFNAANGPERTHRPVVLIRVRNDSTYGISSTEVRTDGDKVKIIVQGTEKTYRIMRPSTFAEGIDAGMCAFECEPA